MRPGALLPAALSAAAVVLSFLCLFAGHKKDFMEGYHIVTLNTSRIGQNLVNDTSSKLPGALGSFVNNVTSSITGEINGAIDSIAEELGIKDFYSYHILDYCYGDYTPQPVPNNTVPAKLIHKNVTDCSNTRAMYSFNATDALQDSLRRAGHNITLDEVKWPKQITEVLTGLRVSAIAVFILYCIGIGLAVIAFVVSVLGIASSGGFTACLNIIIALLAFFAIGIASAIVTVIMVKGSNALNKYGHPIGVEAHRGNKFLAITWAATGAMFLATLVWTFECCSGHRRRRVPRGEKAI